MKPLIVGEVNPYGPDPEFALYPSPPNCAGDRLCRLVMGLDPDDYLERFDRANLCDYRWAIRPARARAYALLDAVDVLVLLGARVCDAFRLPFKEPFRIAWMHGHATSQLSKKIVILPHPSGRCRRWNEPGAFDRTRGLLRDVGALS